MSVLNIRGVPEDLTSAVRIAAVKAGLPIREFVIKSLSDTVGLKSPAKPEPIISKKAEAAIEKKLRAPERHNAKHRSSPIARATNKKTEEKKPKGECPLHGRRYCRLCPGYA